MKNSRALAFVVIIFTPWLMFEFNYWSIYLSPGLLLDVSLVGAFVALLIWWKWAHPGKAASTPAYWRHILAFLSVTGLLSSLLLPIYSAVVLVWQPTETKYFEVAQVTNCQRRCHHCPTQARLLAWPGFNHADFCVPEKLAVTTGEKLAIQGKFASHVVWVSEIGPTVKAR